MVSVSFFVCMQTQTLLSVGIKAMGLGYSSYYKNNNISSSGGAGAAEN